MVKPIRVNAFPTSSSSKEMEGLYVIGESNGKNLDIPHLPSLKSQSESNGSIKWIAQYPGADEYYGWVKTGRITDWLSDGDIIWIDPWKGEMRTVLSCLSNANTLLLTEKCENRCLFCSQPPNTKDDIELYVKSTLALLNFNSLGFVGLSGGEPTYNTRAFFHFLDNLNIFNNRTKLHILTNGRKFRDSTFAKTVKEKLSGREVLWGVPLYGHKSSLHDYLVDAHGAFIDTIKGLSNLTQYGQNIELRIVPTKNNIQHLTRIIDFIASNYLNIKVISIMNMEPKGYGRKNFNFLYENVSNQIKYLESAIEIGESYGLFIRLFNYPICLLSEVLRVKANKSISDWKNYYPDECFNCEEKNNCGGFFASATGEYLEKVRPIS